MFETQLMDPTWQTWSACFDIRMAHSVHLTQTSSTPPKIGINRITTFDAVAAALLPCGQTFQAHYK